MSSGTNFTSNGTDGMKISFNYPDGWAFQERSPGVLIQGEKNGTIDATNRSVVTIARVSGNGTTIDKIKNNDVYIKTGKIVNETNRTIDGVEAKVINIDEMAGPERGKLGEVELIIFSKDNYIYTISFVTGGTLKSIENDINFILNSFHVIKQS